MLLENDRVDALERLLDGHRLLQHVDAVLVLFDHALDRFQVTRDRPEPRDDVLAGFFVHGRILAPGGGGPGCQNRMMAKGEPLAARMRPRDLDEFVGQPHLVGDDRMLRRAIDAGQLPSMILWGPPGTGKTTLAAIAAKKAKARFVAISAVSSGVAELRKIIEESRKLRQLTNQGTVLFIDEIHRFNKAQQDVVLPYVENGDVTFLGATTENPSFEVNSALLSRSRVYVLQPLSEDDVRVIVRRAMTEERGLAGKVVAHAGGGGRARRGVQR